MNNLLETLLNNGTKLESSQEGTCTLYELEGKEYVVLADNTVITRDEDLADDDPIFPGHN